MHLSVNTFQDRAKTKGKPRERLGDEAALFELELLLRDEFLVIYREKRVVSNDTARQT